MAILAVLITASSEPGTAASSALKSGISAYKKSDYKSAVSLLSKAAAEDPYNAELHYYLANCYVFQHDGEAAIKEYSRCFELEPLSTYGQYSRQSLLGFGKKFKGFCSKDDGNEHLSPDDPKSIRQAVELIRKQTVALDKLAHTSGEKSAEAAIRNGESHARQISKDAELLSEELTPHARSQAAQEELHEIKQKAVFAGQHARYQAQQTAAKQMEFAAQNAISLESSAASLLRLMSEDPKPGHVKLKALGTNLYVRNYGMEPKPPLEPLLAEWELIGSSKLKSKLEEVNPEKLETVVAIRDKNSATKADGKTKTPANRPARKKPEQKRLQTYEESSELEFVPGSSKVIVTDMRGRVLLHIKEKTNRQEK